MEIVKYYVQLTKACVSCLCHLSLHSFPHVQALHALAQPPGLYSGVTEYIHQVQWLHNNCPIWLDYLTYCGVSVISLPVVDIAHHVVVVGVVYLT
jgi:hypothetical protein